MMLPLVASWHAVRGGGRRALEAPLSLAAVGAAAVLQLLYESKRPSGLPAMADWLVTGLLMSAFLAFVLRTLVPAVSFGRAFAAYVGAQALSTGVLTLVFLAARAPFLSVLAPLVPVAFSALAGFAALGVPPRRRWLESLSLGAIYAVVAFAFAWFLQLLPGGSTALPATAFFAFMGLFAAAAPAALEAR